MGLGAAPVRGVRSSDSSLSTLVGLEGEADMLGQAAKEKVGQPRAVTAVMRSLHVCFPTVCVRCHGMCVLPLDCGAPARGV